MINTHWFWNILVHGLYVGKSTIGRALYIGGGLRKRAFSKGRALDDKKGISPTRRKEGPFFWECPTTKSASFGIISKSEEIRAGEHNILISLISPRDTAATVAPWCAYAIPWLANVPMAQTNHQLHIKGFWVPIERSNIRRRRPIVPRNQGHLGIVYLKCFLSKRAVNYGYIYICKLRGHKQYGIYNSMPSWHMLTVHSELTNEVGTKSWICWLSHDKCSEQAIEWDEILNLRWNPQSIPACIGSNDCGWILKKIGQFSFDF
jgi:hypothetical protein